MPSRRPAKRPRGRMAARHRSRRSLQSRAGNPDRGKPDTRRRRSEEAMSRSREEKDDHATACRRRAPRAQHRHVTNDGGQAAGPRGRRSGSSRLVAPELRRRALPRAIPGRPHSPVPAAVSRRCRGGRRLCRRGQRGPPRQGRCRRDRLERRDPRRSDGRAREDRRLRHQDPDRVRRRRTLAGELRPRDDVHREPLRQHVCAPVRTPEHRSSAAAEALRDRRTAEQVLPAPRRGRDLRVRADRRRCRTRRA